MMKKEGRKKESLMKQLVAQLDASLGQDLVHAIDVIEITATDNGGFQCPEANLCLTLSKSSVFEYVNRWLPFLGGVVCWRLGSIGDYDFFYRHV